MKLSGKCLWLFLGFLCLGLGTLGIVLPFLPTVPLYMGTVICFARSSRRLHQWFLQTKLYKNHLESFRERRELEMKTKCTIMAAMTLMLAVGFVMMDEVLLGRVVLGAVWLAHLYYFFFRVKTIRKDKNIKVTGEVSMYD